MSDVITQQDAIRITGTIIAKLDELRSCVDSGTAERKQLDVARDALDACQRKIVKGIIDANTEKFKSHAASLQEINDELLTTISDVTEIAETLQNLVKFVEVVGEIASLVSSVAAPSPAPLFAAAMKAKSAASSEKFAYFKSGTAEIPTEFFTEDKTSLLPVEEVLHGVELTPEKLIITVATGGCTGEDSFHIDVNKGFTGQPPYLVTIYRIEPDDCKGAFEPMKIAFSKEKLGLDGAVEFILRNKIGNTSQHRLDS